MTCKHLVITFAVASALVLPVAQADAQGRRGGNAAVPRAGGPPVGRVQPRVVGPPIAAGAPYRHYGPQVRTGVYFGYPGYGYGYPGYGYPAFSLGFGYGYPAYGWGYLGYGWGYPAYGWGHPGYGYGYPGYGYGYPGYFAPVPGRPYGGVRIDLPQRGAQVSVGGYFVGTVDDFDGAFQQLNLEPGAHRIEIQAPEFEPIAFEIKLEPGQTITYRASMRPLHP